MTGPIAGGDRWPLPEHRSAGQIAADGRVVGQQLAELRSSAAGRRAASLLTVLQARQRGGGTPFVPLTLDGDGTTVLVAENELVVAADQQQLTQLGDLLRDYDPQVRPGRRPRRARVFRSRKPRPVDQLRAQAKVIREVDEKNKTINANLNPLLPVGYVVKGDNYPSTTAGLPTFAGPAASDVRVAVVDTGLTTQTRTDGWLTGMVNNGADPLNEVLPDDRIDWSAGHGTFVAGIVRRVAPGCEIVVYRFTGLDGLGTEDVAADMLTQAAEEGAAAGRRLIINASFGALEIDGEPPLTLQDAVADIQARFSEVLIVASAGNDGTRTRFYPAAFKDLGVQAVGALNSDHQSGAEFSNRGDWVDCSAVGVGVVSTFVKGLLPPVTGRGADIDFGSVDAYGMWSGTSFSAAQISGAVADLCLEDSSLSPRDAFDLLLQNRPTLTDFGTVVEILPGTPPA
jgi:hypothetical protein